MYIDETCLCVTMEAKRKFYISFRETERLFIAWRNCVNEVSADVVYDLRARVTHMA